jgi:AcrR family transcriptional regulator
MKKKAYRNSLRSETMIKQAVVSLLKKKKDFYAISVCDVCEESGLNRGTFYNHYANIGDVANAIEDDLMAGMSALWVESQKEPFLDCRFHQCGHPEAQGERGDVQTARQLRSGLFL